MSTDKTVEKRDKSPSKLGLNDDLIRDLIRKRAVVKGRLTKFSNYIQFLEKSEFIPDRRNRIDLRLRIQGATNLGVEFNAIQLKIEETVSENDITEQLNQRQLFEDSYYPVLAQAESLLSADEEVTDLNLSKQQVSSQSFVKSVELPTIVLPNFDGSYERWLEYRDKFLSLVHRREEISSIQKFHYLKASLEGEALGIVDSIEVSADNYAIAWSLLKNRYNNNRLLIQNHVKCLFTFTPITKESPTFLNKLIETVTKNLRSLKTLGEPTDSWYTLINYLIVSKLDRTTEREWETYKSTLYSNVNNSKYVITTDELIKFLKSRADMLLSLQMSHSKDTQVYKNTVTSKSHYCVSHSCNVTTDNHDKSDRVSNNKGTCLMCSRKHSLYSCYKFINSDLDSKLKFIREHKLCENCLRSGHALQNCKLGPCRKCDKKHNTLLHSDNIAKNNNSVAFHVSHTTERKTPAARSLQATSAPSQSSTPAVLLPDEVNNAPTQTQCLNTINSHCVLLSTAVVEVSDTRGNYHKARALLDNGSQRCFITERLCQLINVPLLQSTNEIRGVGDSVVHCSRSCTIDIRSCSDNTYSTQLHCFVLSQIAATMPPVCQLNAQFCIPDNIRLADPNFIDSKNIDLLIGADRFWDLLDGGIFRLPSGPYLYNSKLGWIISGPILHISRNTKHIQCNVNTMDSLDSQLRMFWELEELPQVSDTRTAEERACEEHFLRTTTRNSEGRFCVQIPFKQSPDSLGESYSQAERRFLALERRLQRSQDYKFLYAKFMEEYESLGHMTQISSYENPCYFMPHHGVFREHSTTTKLRVVFDASAKSSTGNSLNDLQLVGPAIQGDLIAILLRFRQHKYVVCADVEKMYRQCLVTENQRNLQMILWRSDPSLPIGMYQLNTVTYGTASAPFLSVRCLKQLAVEATKDHDVQRVINEDAYVDDYLFGLDDKEALLDLCKRTSDVLLSGCFPLRKWMFNFNLNTLDKSCDQYKSLSLNENMSSKTLGLNWKNLEDNFYFNTQIEINDKPVTKRTILSNVSQIFDPLGLLTPSIIVVKILLQQLWLLKLGWDDSVPNDVARQWNRFVISLNALNTLRIPRHAIGTYPLSIQCHIFCDASELAYGTCIYIRTINRDSTVSMRLLVSKAKVAPLKPISIPRLELCGALLGARLYNKVRSSLHVDFDNVIFWVDSSIVLAWLGMSLNRLKTFVQNRIAEIHELTSGLQWRHVASKDNPADFASRGVSLNDLSSSALWWEGPVFLKDSDFQLDSVSKLDYSCNELPEVKLIVNSAVVHDASSTLFPFNRFSQYNRMLRAMAFILRFYHNSRNKFNKISGPLSVLEINQSKLLLAKLSQLESFPIEYNSLLNNKSSKFNSSLLKLNLFFDNKDQLIRVGGRLDNSDFNFNKKHPILLSSKHQFCKLLFRHEHIQILHAAPQALLYHVRDEWWPIRGRDLARQVIHRCVTCTRLMGKTLTPIMGNLPKERITPSFVFYRTGVDYLGPLLILNRKGKGATTTKAYVCLFVCFVTRAIHLELVSDLSSEAYLLALKRFISRRGKPTEIFSDNGRNFVGLMNDFKNFLRNCSPDILEYTTSQQIKFSFIPPYSPHFGGLWEAGVKSCKYHIRRVIRNAHLTFEEFSTVLSQIEAVLNSRPLSPLSSDPQDLSPLTPSHFLIGRPLTAPACDDITDAPVYRLNRYQRVEQIRQHFWSRWAKEYVSELQVRRKWTTNKDELKPNTLVVIKDNNLPPLKWHLGRIMRTIPGKDGVSRVADIQTVSGVTRRAYSKICPLLQDVEEDGTSSL